MTTAEVAEALGLTESNARHTARARGWQSEIMPGGALTWARADVERELAYRAKRAERLATRTRIRPSQTNKKPSVPSVDSFTRAGAEKLARIIRDYWKARGRTVNVRVEPNNVGFLPAIRSADWYVVRSDMVDGRPRK